jgi:hypothetical protein
MQYGFVLNNITAVPIQFLLIGVTNCIEVVIAGNIHTYVWRMTINVHTAVTFCWATLKHANIIITYCNFYGCSLLFCWGSAQTTDFSPGRKKVHSVNKKSARDLTRIQRTLWFPASSFIIALTLEQTCFGLSNEFYFFEDSLVLLYGLLFALSSVIRQTFVRGPFSYSFLLFDTVVSDLFKRLIVRGQKSLVCEAMMVTHLYTASNINQQNIRSNAALFFWDQCFQVLPKFFK